MFERLGRVIVKYRRSAVALFIVSVLVSGVIGSLVFSRLDSGGYSNPASESYEVYEYLKNDLKIEDPAIVVVVDASIEKLSPAAGKTVFPAESFNVT